MHALFYCPVDTFLWNIARNVIKTMVSISIRFDIRAALLNFYIIKDEPIDKNTRSLINTLLLAARRVIYTLYYREDEVVKSSVLSYEFIKNIRLIQKFRKECSVFLKPHIGSWRMYMLTKDMSSIKRIIKGRPAVQYYVQKYREDNIW